jgi:hypothetical protein
MRLFALVACAFLGQESPAPKSAVIEGSVLQSGSRLPIPNVRIFVDELHVDTTDGHGRFRLKDVNPGVRTIKAYQPISDIPEIRTLRVAPGQTVERLDIVIRVNGSISGVVFDEEGMPLRGGTVVLLQPSYSQGELSLRALTRAAVNRLGEFELHHVPSERRVYLRAIPLVGELRPAYHPDALTLDAALPITISSGERRLRVDIRLRPDPTHCIHGEVAPAPSARSISLLVRERLPGDAAMRVYSPEGRFPICGLYDGDYHLEAIAWETERTGKTFAQADITISGRDVHNVRLLPLSLGEIHGEITVEPPVEKQAQTEVKIEIRNRAFPTRVRGGFRVAVPGAFQRMASIEDVVMLDEIPSGFYVRSNQRTGDLVRIVLGSDGATLSTTILLKDGTPPLGGTLYVFPASADSEAALAKTLRAVEIENGAASFADSFAPGDYLALALDLVSDSSPEFFARLLQLRSAATPVRLRPNESVTLRLRLAE